MSLGLHIDVDEIDRKVVLRLDGRLDAATSPILERRVDSLVADGHHSLLVDMVRLEYLSSAGMRLLLAVSKKLKAKHGALVLFSIDDEVMGIIRMAGFEKIFTICSTEQDALQTMS